MHRFADHVLLRLAALEMDDLSPFRCPRVLRVARDLDAVCHSLDERREGLSERLFRAVSGQVDPSFRGVLLDVKRSVFNDRAPRSVASVAELAAGLRGDPSLLDELREWEDDVRRYRDLLREGEEAVRVDWAEVIGHLAELWRDPRVQTGILFAQPQLYRQLDGVLAGDDADRGVVDPKLGRAALAYCYRMATKTSPFSTMTVVGVGRLSGSEDRFPGAVAKACDSAFLWNAEVVDAATDRLRRTRDIEADLPLYLNDTARVDGEYVHFIAQRSATPGGASGGGSESLVSLSINPVIELIIALLGRRPGGLTPRSLPMAISDLVAFPRESLARMIRVLIDCGLLVTSLEYDANDFRALEKLAASRVLRGGSSGREAADALMGIQALVDALDPAPPPEKAELLRRVHERLLDFLGGTSPKGLRLDEQTIVHHTCFAAGTTELPGAALRRFEPALARVAALLPLFNGDSPFYHTVQRFCAEVLGDGGGSEDLLTLFRRFCRWSDPSAEAGVASADPFREGAARNPEAIAAAAARGELLEELRGVVTRPGVGDVEIPADFFERWGRVARDFRPRLAPASACYLGQVSRRALPGGPLRFVLNRVVPGYGLLFAHSAGRDVPGSPRSWLGGSLHAALERLAPDAEVVELIGTFGFGGQIRPRLTGRCLVYPGESTDRSGGRSIPWTDVVVSLDGGRRAAVLASRASGRRILPVHLGTLSSIYFPPFYRFVTCFGPALTPDLALLPLMEEALPEEARRGIRHYRRLVTGGVVLLRETWCIPWALLPGAGSREGGFARFRQLRRWARDLGLPRRVFVTPSNALDQPRGQAPSGRLRRLSKPFFVDWDDYTSHLLFSRFSRAKGATLTASEMLPDPEHEPPDPGGPACVTELALEIYGDH
jgi:hypothetical protein